MVCRHYNTGWWSTKCEAGQSLPLGEKYQKKYCLTSGAYKKCDRYIQQKEIDVPVDIEDVKAYVDDSIERAEDRLRNDLDSTNVIKRLTTAIILLFFLTILAILIALNIDYAKEWWFIGLAIATGLLASYLGPRLW